MRMNRKPLNLLVDEELVKKARDHGLNLSKFFENQLTGYFNFIEGKHQNFYQPGKSNTNQVSKNGDKWACPNSNRSPWLPKPRG